jgi:hypothetical protein
VEAGNMPNIILMDKENILYTYLYYGRCSPIKKSEIKEK